MSGLDRKLSGASKSPAVIFPQWSPLLPATRQKIANLRETLIRGRLTPWRFVKHCAVRIPADEYGRAVEMVAGPYENTAPLLFWQSMEDVLRTVIVNTLTETVETCLDKKRRPEPFIRETAAILHGHLIHLIYEEMARIDRNLRGKGYPKSVPLRDVSSQVDNMNGFLNTTKDEMIRSVTQENFDALLHGGKPDKSPRSRRKRRTSQTAKGLTPRQTEALEKVGECKGNWTQAGRLMSMTPKTVREHYFAAYRKLGMSAEAQIETLRTTAKNQQALTVFEELNPTIAGEDEGQAPSLQGKGRIRRDRRH